jgi:hypothetical protein
LLWPSHSKLGDFRENMGDGPQPLRIPRLCWAKIVRTQTSCWSIVKMLPPHYTGRNVPSKLSKSSCALWPAALCLAGSTLFMLVATAVYWPNPEIAFLSDQSPVSWLSSAQLWAIALLALRLGVDRTLPITASVWLGLAMMILAFDEQFMLHEHWKYGCAQWLDACRNRWVTELPIILVGIVGAATLAWLYSLLNARSARVLLACALGIGILAIAVDLFRWPSIFVTAEEGLEVLAESLFAGVLLGLGDHARRTGANAET